MVIFAWGSHHTILGRFQSLLDIVRVHNILIGSFTERYLALVFGFESQTLVYIIIRLLLKHYYGLGSK